LELSKEKGGSTLSGRDILIILVIVLFAFGPQTMVNPVRNPGRVLNPAGIILKIKPPAEQKGIISNGANRYKHRESPSFKGTAKIN
jgi:hypothetical protein